MAAWLLLLVAVLAVAGCVLTGVLSPVVVLDLVSWWPLAVPTLLLAVVAVVNKSRRSQALPALYLTSLVVLGVGVSLSEWEALPSAAADVVGVAVTGVNEGRLETVVDGGVLHVAAGSGLAAYRIRPTRDGGPVGAAEAVERVEGSRLTVVATPRTDSKWFRFGGWTVDLSLVPVWDLVLTADHLDVDLTGLSVNSASVTGSGSVRIDGSGEGRLLTDGDITVEVPPGIPMTVVGDAQVPAGWTRQDGGAMAPTPGRGWTVVVGEGSQVTIVEDSAGS